MEPVQSYQARLSQIASMLEILLSRICSLDEFYQKRKERFESSAVMQAKRIKEVTGRNPTTEEMEYDAQLFEKKTETYMRMESRLGKAPRKIPVSLKYSSLDEFIKEKNI